MSKYKEALHELNETPKKWLITGVAGFIGSNLLESLLTLNQKVVGLDNFSTGSKKNLEEVRGIVGKEKWANFTFIEGDISNLDACKQAVSGVNYVLHQAALGSVPRSIEDPVLTNESNITGFLHMLVAARDEGIENFVYAASSSTYGDHEALPKVEDKIGRPLSPYAVTKYVNELYANVFFNAYGLRSIGLRYFNVFGKRQDPDGAYAAVIPKWVKAMIDADPVYINGDGETSRDFCYIENVVQANILSAVASDESVGEVYNIAVGDRTTLNELFKVIKEGLQKQFPHLESFTSENKPFREGDVRHSQADVSKAKKLLGYNPSHKLDQGMELVLDWYVESLR